MDTGGSGVRRVVEHYESLVELDVAVFMRELDGWSLLSAGEVRPGRWWAEYEPRGADAGRRRTGSPA